MRGARKERGDGLFNIVYAIIKPGLFVLNPYFGIIFESMELVLERVKIQYRITEGKEGHLVDNQSVKAGSLRRFLSVKFVFKLHIFLILTLFKFLMLTFNNIAINISEIKNYD